MMVPVVPIEETKCVMRPPVCSQSSGPVPVKCASGLSPLPNWSRTVPSPAASIAFARSRAVSMLPRGTRTSSAPKAAIEARRSSLMFSGMMRTIR